MTKWLVALSLIVMAGCAAKTETGYKPRKLSDSMTVQRGYYASPFSAESQMAAQERQVEFQNRRPTEWRP